MTNPIIVTGPESLDLERIAGLLSSRPELQVHRRFNLVGQYQVLCEAVAVRSKHPDRPWEADAGWIRALVCDYLRLILHWKLKERNGATFVDVDARYAADLQVVHEISADARVILVVPDPAALCSDAGSMSHEALESRGLRIGRSFAKGLATARSALHSFAAGQVLEVHAVELRRAPAATMEAVLEFCGIALSDAERDVFERLGARLFPVGSAPDERVWRGFRACEEAAVLAGVEPDLGGADEIGTVPPQLVQAWAQAYQAAGADDVGDALFSLAAERHPDAGEVIVSFADSLLGRGLEDEAVDVLLAGLRVQHAEAGLWRRMLALSHRSESVEVAARAWDHPDQTVRGALARWLVARGVDEAAAEAAAGVQNTDWYAA